MDVVTSNYWAAPIFSLFLLKLFFTIFAYSVNKNKRSYETQKSQKIVVTGPKNLMKSVPSTTPKLCPINGTVFYGH